MDLPDQPPFCFSLPPALGPDKFRRLRIRAASIQFVRKLSGFDKPSQTNAAAFGCAIDEIASAARKLLDSLETAATPRDREEWAARASARAAKRFAQPSR
jgi:hypothetical protein